MKQNYFYISTVLLSTLIFLLAACSSLPVGGGAGDDEMRLASNPTGDDWENVKDIFGKRYLQLRPDLAISLGRYELADREFDWSQKGLESAARDLHRLQAYVAGFSDNQLSVRQRFEKSYLLASVRADLFWIEESGSASNGIEFYRRAFDIQPLLNDDELSSDEKTRAVVAVLRKIPAVCKAVRENQEASIAEEVGLHSQRVANSYADQFEKILRPASDEAFTISQELVLARQQAVSALRELADFFARRNKNRTKSFLGRERFLKLLEKSEGLDLGIEALRRAGEKDLELNKARLAKECSAFAPGRSLVDCVAQLRGGRGQDLLAEAEQQIGRLQSFVVARNLVTLPAAGLPKLKVRPSPLHMQWNSAFFRAPGPFRKGRAATFYLTPASSGSGGEAKLSNPKSTAELLMTSVHEVWPGHFLHLVMDDRQSTLMGRFFRFTTTSEGWAHYAEQMMIESGLAEDDPRVRIAQLKYALMRDARLLVAIGLHVEGWSLSRAEHFFTEKSYLDAAQANQQARRGMFDPDYFSYTLGKLMILKLRSDWLRLHPEKSLKDFHDQFLTYGNAPLPLIRAAMLEKRMDEASIRDELL